jgi:putative inorganic carbon (HCO3(-)) transporter
MPLIAIEASSNMAGIMDQNARGDFAPIVPSNLVGTDARQRGRTLAHLSDQRESAINRLYSLSPTAIWDVLKRQRPSFWFVCIYLFFEYVRPQQIYTSMRGPPYARIAIILALVFFMMEQRKPRFRTPEILLATFTAIVLLSSINAFEPSDSFDTISAYLAWVLIYFLIANTIDTEERFLVFMLSFLLYNFKMSNFGTRSWASEGFAFRNWGTTGAPGFFQNSGEFGIEMCIFLPLIVAFILALGKHWPMWQRWIAWGVAGTAITGIVASSSRGALIGLGAVVFWILLKSRKRFRALVIALVLGGLVYAITPEKQKMRLRAAGGDETSVSRTTAWKQGIEMMQDYPVLGIGYQNWTRYHDTKYGYHILPHNVFVQAGAELGYSGLICFVALIGCTFVINRRTRKLATHSPDEGRFILYMAHGLDGALVGFLASGFFVTVLYYPFFWINFAMTVALYNAALNKFKDESLSSQRRRPPVGRGEIRAAVRAVS